MPSVRKFQQLFKTIPLLEKGYTLIELLIVLAIIGVLTAIVLGSYRGFGARTEVKNTALELKAELRKYEAFAFATQKNPLPESPDCDDRATPPRVTRIDNYSITITPGTPGTYQVILNCTDITDINAPVTNSLTVTDQLPWPNDWTVATSSDNGSTPCNLNIEIRFLPLNQGVALFCNSATAANNVFVNLTNGEVNYRVFVAASGRVYEERIP